jgi:hypothetical protein
MFPTDYPPPRMISISERTLLALHAIVTFSVTACVHGLSVVISTVSSVSP